ncbi:MAG: hypothetical protein U0V72_00610 [Cytophagales bacterium]
MKKVKIELSTSMVQALEICLRFLLSVEANALIQEVYLRLYKKRQMLTAQAYTTNMRLLDAQILLQGLLSITHIQELQDRNLVSALQQIVNKIYPYKNQK